jgi:hypothetical protein
LKDRTAHKLQDVLEEVRKIRESKPVLRPVPKAISPWKGREVKTSTEFLRIQSIPERDWSPYAPELARELTSLLKTPMGEQQMFDTQAMALHDLYTFGSVLCVIRVGGGKSLPMFLAPYVLRAFRPLLVVPGNLLEKTEKHMKRDRYHWQIPSFIRVESYEKLGHPDHGGLLYEYQPDLIMFDEITRCKNTAAVVTTRFQYYFDDAEKGFYKFPGMKEEVEIKGGSPKRGGFSGTLFNRSMLESWHLMKWILPRASVPMPLTYSELMEWSLALDADVGEMHRIKPGVLLELCGDSEEAKALILKDPRKAARQGFRRRLVTIPGVVSLSTPFLGVQLVVSAVEKLPPPDVIEMIKKARKFEMPDGQELQDGHVVAMRVKELGRGLYYRPKPIPPEEYTAAKKKWAKTCRKVIAFNMSRIDSEGQLIRAMLDEGKYSEHLEVLKAWLYWKSEFKEGTETVWVSDFALKYAKRWMEKHPRGIVWVGHKGFGRRLAKYTGVSYYGMQSRDKNDRYIEDHPHNTPMIASIKSNLEGKNLQFGWSDNLIMYPIRSGEWYEQLIGRTHRLGQQMDTVNVEIFMTCLEDYITFWAAASDQEFAQDMESSRKLLYADVLVPKVAELPVRDGALWKPGDIKLAC